VFQQFKRLLQHVRGLQLTSIFQPAKDDVINIIIDMWEKHINLDAIIICAQLSFDSATDAIFQQDQLVAAERWFLDFAAKYAVYWQLSTASNMQQARNDALLEWSNFIGRSAGSCFDQLDDEIAALRTKHSSQGHRFNPRAVWNLHLLHSPIIAHAAVALLSVAGSEAAVERSFSAQGIVHSDRRNRMADATVEAEMFIKFNQRIVATAEQRSKNRKDNKKAAEAEHCIEMVEEYEEDEKLPSVAGVFGRPERKEDGKEEERKQEGKEENAEEQEYQEPAVSAIAPAPAVDNVQAFIESFVSRHSIHASFRWRDHHMQQLEAEGLAWKPPMRDTDTVLKRKIMAYVRAAEERGDDEA
jgi:hypothetical protein